MNDLLKTAVSSAEPFHYSVINSLGDVNHIVYRLTTGDLANLTSTTCTLNITNTVLLAICTALVLLMVPALGFFYSGLLRKKNALHIILQCMASSAIVSVIWITFGFSAAFGPSIKGIIGDPSAYPLFRNVIYDNNFLNPGLFVNVSLANGVPFILFWLFQLSFAIITPALVVGAFADRLKWRGNVIFTILFTVFVYIPVCHWIWGGGFLSASIGAIDWAGGIVIHVTCGFAAIASVIVLGKRHIPLKESKKPHNIPLVAIGAALLFFGWFGFNTGGATYVAFGPGNANGGVTLPTALQNFSISQIVNTQLLTAGVAGFVNSFLAMSMGMLVWLLFDWIFNKKVTLIGALTGGIAGLATITPAAGFVPIWVSLPIGLLGGMICYMFAKINHGAHFDDALEVWPVHGMGGVTGSIIVSIFAASAINLSLYFLPPAPTWIAGAGISQPLTIQFTTATQIGSLGILIAQLIAVALVAVWTLVISIIIFLLARFVFVAKLSNHEQIVGADIIIQGETAYSPEYNAINILNGVGEQTNSHGKAYKEFNNIFENINKELAKYKLKDLK